PPTKVSNVTHSKPLPGGPLWLLPARSVHTIGRKIAVRMTGFKVQPPSYDGRSSAPISVSVLPEIILLEYNYE
ncbi:MAG: hypothetical protein WCN85_09410, partial [Burkholderiales bacterium]